MDRPALDPQTIAERVGAGMLAEDAASRGLGMQIEAMGPGYARMSMTVRPEMLNGFKICHGGYITLLADSGFAFACNSYNELTLAAGIVVDFIAPAREGDRLTAEATRGHACPDAPGCTTSRSPTSAARSSPCCAAAPIA